MSQGVGRLHIVFLGFPNTPTSNSRPARRLLSVLPKFDHTKTIFDFLAEILLNHFADDQVITQKSLEKASFYTGQPDFALILGSSNAGILHEGETLMVINNISITTSSVPDESAENAGSRAIAAAPPSADFLKKLMNTTSSNAPASNHHKEPVFTSKPKSAPPSHHAPPTPTATIPKTFSIQSLASIARPAAAAAVASRAPRKKCLLIGINYKGMSVELKGCINDVKNMYKLVTTRWGYKDTQEIMKILTDESATDLQKLPTKKNILLAFRWLMDGVLPGDSLYIHFSGHGSQQEEDGDDFEEDGLDDTLVPLDYEDAGQVVDDDLNDILVKPLPKGVKLTVFMDCCHSGTMMDLPYTFNSSGELAHDVRMGLLGASEGDIVMISGCMETQTSADAKIAGMSTGAMSYALLKTIQEKGVKVTYKEVLESIRDILKKKGYKQVPQLAASKLIDINSPFNP